MFRFIQPDSHYTFAVMMALKSNYLATNEPAAPLGHFLGKKMAMRASRYVAILAISETGG